MSTPPPAALLAALAILASPSALARQCEGKFVPQDGAFLDGFGWSVAVWGESALIGAPGDDDQGSGSGSVYVWGRVAGQWMEGDKLLASNGAEGDGFGSSVAITPGRGLAGAPAGDGVVPDSGTAYVFEEFAGAWTEVAALVAGDGSAGDAFGHAVALRGDVALVGARLDDDVGTDGGSAYVFEHSGGSWPQADKLTAPGGAPMDLFGSAVALGDDTALIGTPGDDDLGPNAGSAHLFERVASGWVHVQELHASDGSTNDLFGSSVSLDGDSLVIGAWGDDDLGSDAGAAYVFERGATGWVQSAKLLATDGAAADVFGVSVALEGDECVVGAWGNDELGLNAGAAYVFGLDAGGWTQLKKLLALDGGIGDQFGGSVSIGGFQVAVGARFDDPQARDSGSAYAFDRRCPIGFNFCSPAVVNSTGLPGVASAYGSTKVIDNDVTLVAGQLPPGQFGYYLVSLFPGNTTPPGSQGVLCLSGNTGRYNSPSQVLTGPEDDLRIDLTALPLNPPVAVQPGDGWNFQCWYRDVGDTNNFTDVVRISFQ